MMMKATTTTPTSEDSMSDFIDLAYTIQAPLATPYSMAERVRRALDELPGGESSTVRTDGHVVEIRIHVDHVTPLMVAVEPKDFGMGYVRIAERERRRAFIHEGSRTWDGRTGSSVQA
jgi:hypothetical protein